MLQCIVSANQSAFISGQLISNNVMIAYELLHSMKSKQKGKVGSMAKAYNKVEWTFLEAILRRMGFGIKIIRLIMDCVGSVSYSVLLDGRPSNIIRPSRGLRQGGHLSPYLFIIYAEGLSQLLRKAEMKGDIRGMAMARGGTRINFLMFADDCIIFNRVKIEEWRSAYHVDLQWKNETRGSTFEERWGAD